MDNNNNNTNTPLATAWNEAYGKYSEDLANKIINFEKKQKLKFKSVLDICCGSGNLLKIMHANGKNCYGTETIDDFVEYNYKNHPDFTIKKSNTILDFDNIRHFDLITCTNNILNNLTNLKLWKDFFDKVYANLNNGGVFIFDFYTQKALSNWNSTSFKETENYDIINIVKSEENDNKSTISNIFFVKNSSSKYKKAEHTEVKYALNSDSIKEEITKSKFRYLIPVDANLKPISSFNDTKIAYIIAIKREGV